MIYVRNHQLGDKNALENPEKIVNVYFVLELCYPTFSVYKGLIGKNPII